MCEGRSYRCYMKRDSGNNRIYVVYVTPAKGGSSCDVENIKKGISLDYWIIVGLLKPRVPRVRSS